MTTAGILGILLLIGGALVFFNALSVNIGIYPAPLWDPNFGASGGGAGIPIGGTNVLTYTELAQMLGGIVMCFIGLFLLVA